MYLFIDYFPVVQENNNISLLSISPLIFAAFTSIATHNSDTWMTEIGINSSAIPRLITNLKKQVPKGTSGGVTILGTIAGLFGASIISFVYFIFLVCSSKFGLTQMFIQFVVLTLMGTVGGLIDSLEGATIQGLYYCDRCQKVTERQIHKCGNTTRFLKGNRLVTNDLVNISSAFLSGILAILGFLLIENFF